MNLKSQLGIKAHDKQFNESAILQTHAKMEKDRQDKLNEIAVQNGFWLKSQIKNAKAYSQIRLERTTQYKVKSLVFTKPLQIIGQAGSVIILSKGGITVNFDKEFRKLKSSDYEPIFLGAEYSNEFDNFLSDREFL